MKAERTIYPVLGDQTSASSLVESKKRRRQETSWSDYGAGADVQERHTKVPRTLQASVSCGQKFPPTLESCRGCNPEGIMKSTDRDCGNGNESGPVSIPNMSIDSQDYRPPEQI
jgi:hypothetical protein